MGPREQPAGTGTPTVVERLPNSRSGEILRATSKRIGDGEECEMAATIDAPEILAEIADCALDAADSTISGLVLEGW